ncbi:MAG: DeoR/GlpR transcriptional regulator [Clostridia bacterium]|nr:DeoR/GlpR transcriptional regulator [Clostridia bacterium]
MYKCEREGEIIALLNETEYATVEYLSQKMNISASSIRRDLKNLEDRGLVSRSYGGVKLAHATGKHIPFSLRSQENSLEKKHIAKAAVSLINPKDVVFLDGSSSAFFAADLLPAVSGLTVITNNIGAMSCFSSYNIKAYCTGGVISSENKSVLVGGYTEAFLKNIRADVVIFSVQGVSPDGNFYDCYADEVAVRNVMLANARKKILLCDSSKLGQASTFYQCNLSDVDYVICDRPLDGFFTDPAPEKYILA